MRTRLLEVAREGDRALDAAARILLRGGLVAFPTETVYGLGALGLDPRAVERIFLAKERPRADPLILHVPDLEAARSLVAHLPPAAEALARRFWPGPLTLVLPKSARVPEIVTAGLASVAVRAPAHPVALELLRRVGQPLAAPSANRFGRASPTTAAHVLADLDGRIEAVLDAGPTTVGVESTVLDLRGEPTILRPGGVTREEIEAALGRPVAAGGAPAGGPLPSPGLLERHYRPRAAVFLFEGEAAAAVAAMRRAAADGSAPPPVAVLAYTEELPEFEDLLATVQDLGSRADPAAVARNLYAAFRRADEAGANSILVRAAPPGGLGEAINDRLRRASSRVVGVGQD